MNSWGNADIPSLAGKVALVTGSNSGLGLETARMLGEAGARVLMACRNRAKAEAVAGRVPNAEIVELDLASLQSVARAAEAVSSKEPSLDLLINNAGLMAVDRSTTEDGFETQFGVNHLGHFALTARLMPLLVAAPAARIVNVSSLGHRLGTMRFDDLMFDRRRYDGWRSYFQSKLANLLFTAELDRRLRRAGMSVAALGAHPGVSRTDLGQEGTGVLNRLARPFMQLSPTPAAGAMPTVRAATDPQARGGDFYGPRLLWMGPPVKETPSRRARNEDYGRQLWEVSERLTGVRFEIPPP